MLRKPSPSVTSTSLSRCVERCLFRFYRVRMSPAAPRKVDTPPAERTTHKYISSRRKELHL